MKRNVRLRNKKRLERSGGIARTRWKKKRKPDPERGLRVIVRRRSGGVCEVIYLGHRCWRAQNHTHHIAKRSRAGRAVSADALMAVCWPHHDLLDNASRSQVTTLNDGQVLMGRMRVVRGPMFLGGYECRMDTVRGDGADRDHRIPELRPPKERLAGLSPTSPRFTSNTRRRSERSEAR